MHTHTNSKSAFSIYIVYTLYIQLIYLIVHLIWYFVLLSGFRGTHRPPATPSDALEDNALDVHDETDCAHCRIVWQLSLLIHSTLGSVTTIKTLQNRYLIWKVCGLCVWVWLCRWRGLYLAEGPPCLQDQHLAVQLWTPQPRVGGLSIAKTEKIQRMSRSEAFKRRWATKRLASDLCMVYVWYIHGIYLVYPWYILSDSKSCLLSAIK